MSRTVRIAGMDIPERFVEAFAARVPHGLALIGLPGEETRIVNVAGAWELFCGLVAEEKHETAHELMKLFGFVPRAVDPSTAN